MIHLLQINVTINRLRWAKYGEGFLGVDRAMTDKLDIVREVENGFDTLSPQLQVAARYIVGFPDDVALYSMREIATRAAVKPATMVRLASKFGYANYNNFRDDFRKRISMPASGYAARAREMQLRNSNARGNSLVFDMLEAERDNIERTFDVISDEMLAKAAMSIVAAEKVYIIGLRKCFPIAYFFKYATRDFFATSRLIQGSAGLFREEISDMTDRDVVLAIAFDPYTRETVEAVNMARKAGSQLIAITDSIVSPLARDAHQVFIAANRSPSFFRSLAGALTIVQALVAAIVTHIGDPAIEALDQSDKRRRANHIYWNS